MADKTFKDHFDILIDRIRKNSKITKSLLTISGLIFVGISYWVRGYSSDDKLINDIYTYSSAALFITGLVFNIFGALIITAIDKDNIDLIRDLYSYEKKHDKAIQDREYFDGFSTFLMSWLSLHKQAQIMQNLVMAEASILPSEKKNLLYSMLEFMSEKRGILFKLEDEYWTMQIYEFNPITGSLECQASVRSRPSDANGPHRTWAKGEGHVGKTFESAKELIIGDATAPDICDWVQAPEGKKSDTDFNRYVSFAAIPIALESHAPLGVIVLTSDRAERFTKQAPNSAIEGDGDLWHTLEPLRGVASDLAQIIYMCNAKRNLEEDVDAKSEA
jgi:hypothetical protein